MYSYQWTVKVKKPFGKLPVGAWVEIVKNNTASKPSMLEIFKAFESKYGVRVPSVSDQYFDIRKDF